MHKRHRNAEIFAALAVLAMTAAIMTRMEDTPSPPSIMPDGDPMRSIVRVVDGDTIILDGDEIIRLIGVDAPESTSNRKLTKDMAKLPIDATKDEVIDLGKRSERFVRLVAEGKQCWLEYDKNRKDMYGRTLAYVHLDDGRILNELIVSSGYGRAYVEYPFKYGKRYVALQQSAESQGRGLWAKDE